ncbi:hypothetical protein WJX73_008416 [Symbiochloris irregularis]|uniref:Uncharacterized protein n=1 Tax=Symbiochloris irregularis TaxID=706552 RepID=A0AAW1PGG8_9CHLO
MSRSTTLLLVLALVAQLTYAEEQVQGGASRKLLAPPIINLTPTVNVPPSSLTLPTLPGLDTGASSPAPAFNIPSIPSFPGITLPNITLPTLPNLFPGTPVVPGPKGAPGSAPTIAPGMAQAPAMASQTQPSASPAAAPEAATPSPAAAASPKHNYHHHDHYNNPCFSISISISIAIPIPNYIITITTTSANIWWKQPIQHNCYLTNAIAITLTSSSPSKRISASSGCGSSLQRNSPVPVGNSLFDVPPTNASALYYFGFAAGGNVTIYSNGQILTIIPVSEGTGSSTLALTREPRFFTAAYGGGFGFPSTAQTGPGSATVVNPDGTIQAASATAQSSPPPPPAGTGFVTRTPPPAPANSITQASNQNAGRTVAITVPTVVGFVIIVLVVIAIVYFTRRYYKNKKAAQALGETQQPLSDGSSSPQAQPAARSAAPSGARTPARPATWTWNPVRQ